MDKKALDGEEGPRVRYFQGPFPVTYFLQPGSTPSNSQNLEKQHHQLGTKYSKHEPVRAIPYPNDSTSGALNSIEST